MLATETRSRTRTRADTVIIAGTLTLMIAMFLPWYEASYTAAGCDDCTFGWNAWQNINWHWIFPLAAFMLVRGMVFRIFSDDYTLEGRDWTWLAAANAAVVAGTFYWNPNLDALNATQVHFAEVYRTDPLVFTSANWGVGLYIALAAAVVVTIAAVFRTRADRQEVLAGSISTHAATFALAGLGALFTISYVGELVTRF